MFTNPPHTYNFTEHLLFPSTSVKLEKLTIRLKGKTVLITGASYGIGAQLALLLSKCSCHLILVGRTEDKLTTVKEAIIEAGGSAEIYVADLRDDVQITGFIRYLKSSGRSLDVFVNNAGKSIRRPLVESLDRYHDFSRTMAINYEAPVKLMLALYPLLKENAGHVVNVSAINVLMSPAPYWAAYQASKSAFDQWFRAALPELHANGITTSSVYLPLVKTRMIAPTKAYDKMPAMSPEHVAKVIAKCILKRKRQFKPWWTIFAELGSVLFRKSWERTSIRKLQKLQ